MKVHLRPWASISASSLLLLVCHYLCYCSGGDGPFGTGAVSWHSLVSSQYLSFLFLSLFSKLPSWARAVVPKIFYVTEKAWNYYPYTITGNYSCLLSDILSCCNCLTSYETGAVTHFKGVLLCFYTFSTFVSA